MRPGEGRCPNKGLVRWLLMTVARVDRARAVGPVLLRSVRCCRAVLGCRCVAVLCAADAFLMARVPAPPGRLVCPCEAGLLFEELG